MDLISGATGFIGQRVIRSLRNSGIECRALVRKDTGDENSVKADLGDKEALRVVCKGVERIFHCAGYAHAFSSLSNADVERHWRINFEGTSNLVEAAGQAGVKCFVFLSSVKAMAEPGSICIDENYQGHPETPYGQAKRAAEEVVLAVGARYGMHVVNLRLAMVYGCGGRGNLERMGRLVRRGLFPPLPETGNHRSLIHVDDVVSAMRLVASDCRAAGKTYIIANLDAPSGRRLFDTLRGVQGLPVCSWSVPAPVLKFFAHLGDVLEKLFRRRLPMNSEVLDRLLGSAWYSPALIERELGWRASVPLVNGLIDMLKR